MLYEQTADRTCNLECVKNATPAQEFVGPVKIILVDVPKSTHRKRKCGSAAIAFAEMLIGANVVTVLFYTLAFKTPIVMNAHIVLCTIGLQVFMPIAILMHSNLHGPSAPLKPSERRFQHLFLQVFAIMFAGAGGSLVMFLEEGTFTSKLSSIHCWAGLVSGAFCGGAVIHGPGAHFFGKGIIGRIAKTLHMIFGVLAFLSSSVCFTVGLFFSKTFKEWAPLPDMMYILIVFCGIYSVIVACTPIMRMCNKTR